MDSLHSAFSYVSDCLHIVNWFNIFTLSGNRKKIPHMILAVTRVELAPQISLCWELGPWYSSAETMVVFSGGHPSVKVLTRILA